jgi:hypothetical protein
MDNQKKAEPDKARIELEDRENDPTIGRSDINLFFGENRETG